MIFVSFLRVGVQNHCNNLKLYSVTTNEILEIVINIEVVSVYFVLSISFF